MKITLIVLLLVSLPGCARLTVKPVDMSFSEKQFNHQYTVYGGMKVSESEQCAELNGGRECRIVREDKE